MFLRRHEESVGKNRPFIIHVLFGLSKDECRNLYQPDCTKSPKNDALKEYGGFREDRLQDCSFLHAREMMRIVTDFWGVDLTDMIFDGTKSDDDIVNEVGTNLKKCHFKTTKYNRTRPCLRAC